MLNDERSAAAPANPATPGDQGVAPPAADASSIDDLAALIDDGRTYAEAELAFQKTRAAIAGKSMALVAGFAVAAIILLHVALLALAVGLVIALAPLVSIWGAIALVVGGLLLLAGALGYAAAGRGKLIAAMFKRGDTP